MRIKMKIKEMVINRSAFIKVILCIYNHLPFNNKLKISGGKLNVLCAKLKKSKIIFSGEQNSIDISEGCRLNNCRISVNGKNNCIRIDRFATLRDVSICIEDDNNEIIIGEHSSFEGNVHLACIEGTKLEIGSGCMFSANISIRTGDSHSIIDMDNKRINPSKDVTIGNHVWVGNTVLITKGVTVSDNSIIGTGSVVTRKFDESNCVIAGNPAAVVKRKISWDRVRIPM